MIIVKWFKNKIMKIELEYALYSTITEFIKEKEGIVKLVSNLYVILKDVPVDELKKEFIRALAEIVHEENNKDKEVTEE